LIADLNKLFDWKWECHLPTAVLQKRGFRASMTVKC
jgi:hypothetical protein